MTVTELIDELDLKSKSRKRELVYTRCIIYKYLRNKGFSLDMIGQMLNRAHCTILYGLNQYDILNENIKYYHDFAEIKENVLLKLGLTADLTKKAELSNIEKRILDCKNYMDLVKVQQELQKIIVDREEENIFTTFNI